jgi:RHS repeat-associated protein
VYLLTNTSGTRRSEYRYRAYGDRYVTPVGEAVQSPFGYKAREEDRETGLVYMRHRYYSPRLERFLNQDPIGIAGGLNTYGFAGLSPVNAGDPLGLCPECDTIYVYAYIWGPPRWVEEQWFTDFMRSMQYGYGSGAGFWGSGFGETSGGGAGASWGAPGGSSGTSTSTANSGCAGAVAQSVFSAAGDVAMLAGAGLALRAAQAMAAAQAIAVSGGHKTAVRAAMEVERRLAASAGTRMRGAAQGFLGMGVDVGMNAVTTSAAGWKPGLGSMILSMIPVVGTIQSIASAGEACGWW